MWVLAVNPTAGKGKGATLAQYVSGVLATKSIAYQVITGSSGENLRENLDRFLDSRDGVKGVLAIGGDGLAHIVIQSCVPRKIPFAPIPAGTGNDFVRSLNWPLNEIDHFIDAILHRQPEAIDLGLVDGEWFAAILSTGFDSIVNERANRLKWPKGPSRYNVAIALELPLFKPREYTITLDDRQLQTEAMLIAVANGISYGGGMKVAPKADMRDGLFDVLVLRPVSKVEFIKVFPKVYSGEHLSHPAVEMHRSARVSLSSSAVAYADGERIGQLPIVAECIRGAGLTWRR